MRYAITALTSLLLLSGCATGLSSSSPDVVVYTRAIQAKAADEVEAGTCPVIADVMMPDYLVMRDQARVK
jgi:uncharacterized protein YceK